MTLGTNDAILISGIVFFATICLCSLPLTFYALYTANKCWIELITFNKSTHQIQYIPAGSLGPSDEELNRAMAASEADYYNEEKLKVPEMDEPDA